MEVEFAFVADAAEAPGGGKLYVLGAGIDTIIAPSFPAVHPRLSFVLKLKLHSTECGKEHHLELLLWDPDGASLGKLDSRFTAFPREGAPHRPVFTQLVLSINNQVFPASGPYSFEVLVDDHHLKSVALSLEQSTATMGPDNSDPVADVGG